jgi:aminoglycoside phosphotransferase
MNDERDDGDECAVESEELRRALEEALRESEGESQCIVELARRPSPYSSSYALEELDVRLADGRALSVLFKNLSWQTMLEDARHVKPKIIYDPLREIETYRKILVPHRLGSPHFYGAHVDREHGRYWLFIERVTGRKMRHVGEFEIWLDVARWLARMHTHFAVAPETLRDAQPHLLCYDADFYRLWIGRARALLQQEDSGGAVAALENVNRLAERYERVVERLMSLPLTFVHGDFFASNVLVEENAWARRVCPVDWEMAGIGTGLIDLAALTAGSWSERERAELASAYYDALTPQGRWPPPVDEFVSALNCCRLHLAVQLLGWAAKWSPPLDEAQDWLGEAQRLAKILNLN